MSEMASAQAEQGMSSVAKMAVADNAAESRAWWKKCVALRDNRARLACFDTSVPGEADDSYMLPRWPANTMARSYSASAPSAVSPPRTRSNALAHARSVTYRVAAGYGLGIGGHAGSFKVEHGILHTDSGFGSEGDTLSIQGWADNWIARDWSVGLEYLYLNNSGKLYGFWPKGISILTDPVTANARADLHGHMGFANIAYRPKENSWLRPYIGAGLGIGWGSASTDMAAENAFAGNYYYKSKANFPFGSIQGFVGMDIAFLREYYISPFGKVLWISGHPFHCDHRYFDFVFGVAIGRQF